MAISNTYTPIETYTLGSSAASVTFGSGGTIPQTYTDLVIVVNFKAASTTIVTPSIRFNGDTNTNYSNTTIYGIGSGSGTSVRFSNQSKGFLGDFSAGVSSTDFIPYIISINNYKNSSLYKTFLCRYNQKNSSNGEVGTTSGLWRSTNAITSVTITSDGGQNFASGSTFTLYGIAAADVAGSNKATGGTITAASGYTYHAFTSGGTFTPSQNITADILVIAGGGGGGTYSGGGGGGGAGGVLLLANQALTSGTGYTVSVGGGGSANTNGQNSYFGALTQAVGGGKGGSASAGGNGGSGGGASDTGYAAGTGTAGQGYSGGIGTGAGSSPGGGGGGALEYGQNAYGDNTPNIAGKGGSGTNFYYDWAAATSTGVSGYFAGGGGGGVYINSSFANNGGGTGGNGGGGSGSASNKNATTNSGSGGGGGSYTSGPVSPGNGGSGIVIVRYAN
jgi:hypothetical protein